MSGAAWRTLESYRHLPDPASVGVQTRVFPPGRFDEVMAPTGRTERCNRTLLVRVMAQFGIGMILSAVAWCENLLSQMTDGLAWSAGWE